MGPKLKSQERLFKITAVKEREMELNSTEIKDRQGFKCHHELVASTGGN